jgi:DNA-binding LacI/PurR family transcriptional regulator
MATRREVAAAAGVSLRTVSNVVNGFEHVAPETRARVLAAIEQLSYRPSELARSLKSGRSGLVGLMLPELATPYFAELTRVVVEEGAARGFTVVIDQTDGDLLREQAVITRTASGSLFDALILNPVALRSSDVEALAASGPVVFLGEEPFPAFDHVMIDNFRAAHDAVDHLLAIGRRRIAAIGARHRSTSSLRMRGYRAALDDAGIAIDDSLVQYVDRFERSEGVLAMRRLLELDDPPDAVFCFADPLALGAMRALHEQHVAIPGAIALIGIDDIVDGHFATPSLSSIGPDTRFLAAAAFDRIVRRLNGEQLAPETIIAPHTLRVRESTSAPPRPIA